MKPLRTAACVLLLAMTGAVPGCAAGSGSAAAPATLPAPASPSRSPSTSPSAHPPPGVTLITVGNRPCASAPGGGAMWVSNFSDGTISRIDPRTDRVTATYEVGDRPCGIVYLDGHVWVGLVNGAALVEVDPASGAVLATVRVGGQVYDVQTGYGSVWLNDHMGGHVIRVDPRTAKITATIPVGSGVYGLAVTPEGVYAADVPSREVVRVDPATNKVTGNLTLPGGTPYTFAYSPGKVWVTSPQEVSRIDPRRGVAAATIDFGSPVPVPGDPDVLGGFLYVPDRVDGALAKIDVGTDRIVGGVKLGAGFSVAQAGFGSVWVCDFGTSPTIARVDPTAFNR